MLGSKDPSQRIVVTGMGCLSPLGLDLPSSWKAACEGRSGVGILDRFDVGGFPVRIGAQLPGEVEIDGISPKDIRRMDRVVLYALAAGKEAVEHAGLAEAIESGAVDRNRVGIGIGSGIGGISTLMDNHDVLKQSGHRRVSPFTIPMSIANMPGGYLSVHYGLRGPNFCHVSACATGSHAIGECAHLIARGQADVMLAGGVEAPIIPITVSGFAAMKALSTRNDAPASASRPFDRARDGFVLGEGAGVVVLESLAHARKRGAHVIAEVIGYGASADGTHIVQPSDEGDGPARCMNLALESAGITAADVDYVNAHATSTPAGDPPEVRALERVFGDHLPTLPVSATKSMTGHLLGAAGAVEGIFTISAIADGLLPPTINLDDPDPACGLDHVTGKAREQSIAIALSNSFGFGGTNATVIFGAVEA